VPRLVEIEIRDGQHGGPGLGMRPLHLGNQRGYEKLTARRIERTARNDERSFDACAGDETFLKAGSETIQEYVVDGVDRHDSDVAIHLGRLGFSTKI
jgi:hypothetical protein